MTTKIITPAAMTTRVRCYDPNLNRQRGACFRHSAVSRFKFAFPDLRFRTSSAVCNGRWGSRREFASGEVGLQSGDDGFGGIVALEFEGSVDAH